MFRSGTATSVSLVLAAVAAASALLYAGSHSTISTSTAKSSKMPLVSRRRDANPEQLLRDAGLTPDAIAAAGVSAQATTTLVGAAREHITQHGTDQADAMTAWKTAQQQLSSLQAVAQSRQATPEQLSSLETARQAVVSTTATLDLARAALFSAATAGLTEAQRTALANVRAARAAGVELPLPFVVTFRDEARQVAIRDALAEQRTLDEGATLSQPSQDVLNTARQDAATTQAESDLANHAQEVDAAWRQALR